MSHSDQALLEAVRAGDRRALEELIERHESGVFRFGLKMCRQEEDAKDVLQETLLAAARYLPSFRGASSVTTWLYGIARSFCIKKRRTSRFAPQQLESLEGLQARGDAAAEVADSRRGPEELAANGQLQEVLDGAIGGLEPMYREVLLLRDVEGLSAPEVAEVMGLSVAAVKSRLHRARMVVRERVAPHLPDVAEGVAPAAACRDVVETFSRRLEDEIDGSACAALEAHLKECPSCRGRCDSLRASLTLCRGAGARPVPPKVAGPVRRAIRRFLATHG